MTLVRPSVLVQLASVIVGIFVTAVSSAGGFANGSQFTTTVLNGSVQVQCFNGPNLQKVATFTCRRSVLDPVEVDYFVGPAGVNADQVTLSSVLETGEVRNRVAAYDSRSDRTVDPVNLWLAGLIQRPILGIGKNKITFTMIKNQITVNQGMFIVTVNKSPAINCPFSTIVSYNVDDCDSQFTMCDKYFTDHHNCR